MKAAATEFVTHPAAATGLRLVRHEATASSSRSAEPASVPVAVRAAPSTIWTRASPRA